MDLNDTVALVTGGAHGKAKRIVDDLIRSGEVKPAWIGLVVQDLDEKVAQYLKYPGRKGVMLKAVEPESPAQLAGLREGDILLALGSKKIAGVDDYLAASRAVTAGETVEVQVWRGGRPQTMTLKTTEFPIERADQLAWALLGIRVQDLTPRTRKDFRIAAREGVVVTEVRAGSQLARIGVRPGDLIRQVADANIPPRGRTSEPSFEAKAAARA